MNPRLLLSMSLCAAVTAGCGAVHASVRDAARTSDTSSGSAAASTSSTTQMCTEGDLNAPRINAMPIPERITTPLTLDAENETLSPPDTQPNVTAGQAWAKVTASGFAPRTSGTARLVLADLSAKTPATIQDYVWPPNSDHPDTEAKPIYTHTLVWAVIATDQAEVGSGGPSLGTVGTATTVPKPLCFLETAVSYVDAQSGGLLVSENF